MEVKNLDHGEFKTKHLIQLICGCIFLNKPNWVHSLFKKSCINLKLLNIIYSISKLPFYIFFDNAIILTINFYFNF